MSSPWWSNPVNIKKMQDTIYAEVGGGSPEEVKAVLSVFFNRANKVGIDKALQGSSAYTKKSKEYQKAYTGMLNPYEQKVYNRNAGVLQSLVINPKNVLPYNYFENVNTFGNPPWAKNMTSYQDIGRQRFYEGSYP